MKVIKQNKGFTLFELIVTTVIILIVSGLAIGNFSAYLSTGRQRMLENVGNQIDLARAYAQTQAYPTYIEFTKDESKRQNIATIYIKKGSDASATKEILSEEAIGNSQYTLLYIPFGTSNFTASVTSDNSLTLGFNKANLSFKTSDTLNSSCTYTKQIKVDNSEKILYLVKDTGRTYLEIS